MKPQTGIVWSSVSGALLAPVLACTLFGAVLLAIGVASAEEKSAAAVLAPAGYVVVAPNARISSNRTLNGFQVVDNGHVLIRVGARDLYMAEVQDGCGRAARFDTQIAVDARGAGGVDHFSQLVINGRICPILSLAQVERVPAAAGGS